MFLDTSLWLERNWHMPLIALQSESLQLRLLVLVLQIYCHPPYMLLKLMIRTLDLLDLPKMLWSLFQFLLILPLLVLEQNIHLHLEFQILSVSSPLIIKFNHLLSPRPLQLELVRQLVWLMTLSSSLALLHSSEEIWF